MSYVQELLGHCNIGCITQKPINPRKLSGLEEQLKELKVWAYCLSSTYKLQIAGGGGQLLMIITWVGKSQDCLQVHISGSERSLLPNKLKVKWPFWKVKQIKQLTEIGGNTFGQALAKYKCSSIWPYVAYGKFLWQQLTYDQINHDIR